MCELHESWLLEPHEKCNRLFQDVCLIFVSNFINLTYCFGFIGVLRGEDGEKEEKPKEDKGKQKLRQLHTHRYGEPEVQESAFWKKIIAYQQKLLVSCSLDCVFSCWQGCVPQNFSTSVKMNFASDKPHFSIHHHP